MKVVAVIGSRANYGSFKKVLLEMRDDHDIDLVTVVGGSAVLDRYGNVARLMRKDGLEVAEEIFFHLDGENPMTMAKSTGIALIEIATVLGREKPNLVFTIGDRYETMATVLASAYMNIPLAHTMGGEVTGTIDESIRHAATKFATLHYVASEDARKRVIRLGERDDRVFNVGCPRIDEVRTILEEEYDIRDELKNLPGVGSELDVDKPFVLLSYHPVTTEYSQNGANMVEIFKALEQLDMQAVVLWPNSDAGSDEVSRTIRQYRETHIDRYRFCKNLKISTYVRLMSSCAVMLGNSSSAIREGAFIGTPAVNIGTRQRGRERGENVVDVDCQHKEIINAAFAQIAHGRYESNTVYGTGHAATQIIKSIKNVKIESVQKQITF